MGHAARAQMLAGLLKDGSEQMCQYCNLMSEECNLQRYLQGADDGDSSALKQ